MVGYWELRSQNVSGKGFSSLVFKLLLIKGGSSSVVERQLPKLNVAGSIPVSRSNQFNNLESIGTLSSAVNSV